MKFIQPITAGFILSVASCLTASPLQEMFESRTGSIVAVEFFIQKEIDREPRESIGVVLDEAGLIVMNENAIPGWRPPSQLREFKVYHPGEEGDGSDATYLGQDYLTGWHFLRVDDPAAAATLVPVTHYPVGDLSLGDTVWGIFLLPKDFDFRPALMRSYLGLSQKMPDLMHFTKEDVASPGSPVFNMDGAFVGWAAPGIPDDKILIMGRESYNVGLQSPRATTVFLDAKEFLEMASRVPRQVSGNPRPWIGIAGMQPVDKEVAEFLGIKDQTAVVISDVIESGPAAQAGLKGKDIVLAVDGKPIPKFRPDSIALRYFEKQLRIKDPGDQVSLTVISQDGSEPRVIEMKLGTAPTHLKEAEREYFDNLGMAIREFTLFDGINRRILDLDYQGVITEFVRPNSPTASAGLQPGDWIQEIDGVTIDSYDEAVEQVRSIAEDTDRQEFVLLINRNNETQLLRVKIG